MHTHIPEAILAQGLDRFFLSPSLPQPQFMEASETSQQPPKCSEMGSQVPIAMHRPPSDYAEVRVLLVARRAIRQFCKGNVPLHKSQVITSEAHLAVIFGQRVVDKVRATIAVGTQTSNRRRDTASNQTSPVLDLIGSFSRAPCG